MTFAARADRAPVALFAAGSLRAPLEAMAAQLLTTTGTPVRATFGASGLLRERIEQGAPADVFASANLQHPGALASRGWSDGVRRFARNRMCLVVRPGLAIDGAHVLDALLDPAIQVGTSTPRADPSGDDAWEVFRLAEAQRPGAFATLSAKARQLTGGPASPLPPAGRSVYAAFVGDRTVDVFLTYCTNARLARHENPALGIVPLPAALDVASAYGLAVRKGSDESAEQFAALVLSDEGQRILALHGFDPP